MPESNNPALTLVAGTALLKNRLVSINAATGVADYTALTGHVLGVTMDDVDAGDLQGIRLLSSGVCELTAKAAIARGALVYPTADAGKIDDAATATARPFGIALDAATAEGDVIRVAPVHGPAAAAT